MASQGNKQKQKLGGPPSITDTSKTTEFDDAMKEVPVVPATTLSNRPYTSSDDLFPDGEHNSNSLITEDSRFVMEVANLDLLKDVRNKEVIFQILLDKIEELLQLKKKRPRTTLKPTGFLKLSLISNCHSLD